MAYVDDMLMPGETVTYRARISAIVYLPGLCWCAAGVLAAKYLPSLNIHFDGWYNLKRTIGYSGGFELNQLNDALALACFAIGTVMILRAMVLALSTELAITNQRVLAKFGITNIVTTELDRRKIAGVVIEQTVNGRMFNYGRINLRGYMGNISPKFPISKPFAFQKAVNERVRLT
jgi:hypothetical protein